MVLSQQAVSYSQAAVRAIECEMQADARVVVLGEDVGRGGIFGQYKGLQQQFGTQRIIDAPISEAAIISERARRSLPLRVAVSSEFWTRRMPSIAMPSAWGWKPGAQ